MAGKMILKVPPEDKKFRELILFISERSEGDACFGATKLNKLLFYADFLAFRQFGKSITGQKYQRLDFGPAPRILVPVLKDMEADKEIVQANRAYFDKTQKRTLALRSAVLKDFTADEIALVTSIIEHFWNTNATQISDLSHKFIGWQAAGDGEDIPFEAVLVRKPDPNAQAARTGKRLERQAKECLNRNHA